MKRHILTTALLLALSALAPLRSQDPALKESFAQAKTLWGSQGDLPGATAKFEQILAALEPRGRNLEPEWLQMLCETYNWMAILDDRQASKRPKASKDLELLLDLNPDFEIDRSVTNARIQGTFDQLRSAKFCKVKVNLTPEGGLLTLDGKPRSDKTPLRYLTVGAHTLTYVKAGYQLLELHMELAPKENRSLDMTLTRTSSTVTIYTYPAGAGIFLDGKQVGTSSGQAPASIKDSVEKAKLRLEQVSGPFLLDDLTPKKHRLELRSPCFRTKPIALGEDLTTPMADHVLEPIILDPSQGALTVSTLNPGGELFLGGKSFGPVPVKDLQVCAGTYDLQVKFPAGGFSQKVEILDGKPLEVVARPKPRLVYLGFEGTDEFAGRERILNQLNALGSRLKEVAFYMPTAGETPQAALARLKTSKETELTLQARPIPGKPIHQLELILSTLGGEEERFIIKPLEQDPLEGITQRLNTSLVMTEPSSGLVLVDLAGEPTPWVVQADASATKAGIRINKPLLLAGGKPLATVAAYRKLLREAATDKIVVSQGEGPIQLNITQQALEIPLNANSISYPFALMDLRLRILGARGDEANFLRLNQAIALMHYRQHDRALEVLRDAKVGVTQGVSQGTIDYYTGICLLRLGSAYTSEAIQAFNQALKCPNATLFSPDGPLLAPLAKQALEDLKP